MTALNKQALREAAQEEIMLRSVSDTSDSWQDEASPEAVLALLDELKSAENNLIDSECHVAELEESIRDKQALLEAAEKRIAELNQRNTELTAKIEPMDRRIAELEAREVVLPSTQDVHPLGPQSAKIFWEFHRSIVNRCADEIRKVGVKVSIKGN